MASVPAAAPAAEANPFGEETIVAEAVVLEPVAAEASPAAALVDDGDAFFAAYTVRPATTTRRVPLTSAASRG